MTLNQAVFALYYLVVIGGVGAVVGLVSGILASAALRNGWRYLGLDALLGALAFYGIYQVRVYLLLHGFRPRPDALPWPEIAVATALALAQQVIQFNRRRGRR
jgi:hypothetical protein